MLTYCLRKIFGAIPTLLFLTVLTFLLLRLAPGGPFDTERAAPPEVQAQINSQYGLDQPVFVQLEMWFVDLMRGDLRESFQYGQPVTRVIAGALPTSIGLGGIALALSLLIGIPLGGLAAWKQNTVFDSSAIFIAVSGVSIPTYLVASLLILVFSFGLGWLPPALWEGPESSILPILTLASRPMAMIARLTRAAMIETLSEDYIRTAYSKGLSERVVLFKHALKNSLIPVLTVIGPVAANLVTGSFVVELVFQLPGLGRHFVQSILNRDYPLVMGVTLTYGVVLIVFNIAVDLLSAWADPRVRLEGRGA